MLIDVHSAMLHCTLALLVGPLDNHGILLVLLSLCDTSLVSWLKFAFQRRQPQPEETLVGDHDLMDDDDGRTII